MPGYVYDCESYPNYFLIAARPVGGDGYDVLRWVLRDSDEATKYDRKSAWEFFKSETHIGFNNRNYDDWVISAYSLGYSAAEINSISREIITGDGVRALWSHRTLSARYNEISGHHIDLMAISPVFAGLKSYGTRLHAPSIQSLPYDPEEMLSVDQMDDVAEYCINDLNLTEHLYETLLPQIKLREDMGEEYGIQFLHRSDAQMAEAIYRDRFDGQIRKKTEIRSVGYEPPENVGFRETDLNARVDRLWVTRFDVSRGGKVILPADMFAKPVGIGGREYAMGIGGLHSTSKKMHIVADDEYGIVDVDVASYYPALIINGKVSPPSLPGEQFQLLFKDLVDRRLDAKQAGDKTTAQSLKILINGTFGKLADPYSCLYHPQGMLWVTLTGQLYLMMLIEQLTDNGHDVISANTDGLVVRYKMTDKRNVVDICTSWQAHTSLELEYTPYSQLLLSNVNNYVAITTGLDVRTKGTRYSPASLRTLPHADICKKAVDRYLTYGTPPEVTIGGCADMRGFLLARTVKGGALWGSEKLGGVARWYWGIWSTDTIVYASSGNRVPSADRACPMMTIDDNVLKNVDIDRYIDHAYELLADGGIDLRQEELAL
ncbi:hypothetical protein [Thiolapillus sp.]|uniref:hypothetical protein n=1 Tax=Thiolapillus sp. TaxID=2017437 RepID=UPI003AF8BF81